MFIESSYLPPVVGLPMYMPGVGVWALLVME